ncbi:MAG: hypothetical protein JWM80_5860, partial [Cyanobacteria bacterium RYN_339]|nr:hypothetical protein [Cyanobacteria bacterium RYN_339]
VAGRTVAIARTPGAQGTFALAFALPAGGCVLVGQVAGGPGLACTVEADLAGRLARALLLAGRPPAEVAARLPEHAAVTAFACTCWGEDEEGPQLLVSTFPPATQAHQAAVAQAVGPGDPLALAVDLVELAAHGAVGTLAVVTR